MFFPRSVSEHDPLGQFDLVEVVVISPGEVATTRVIDRGYRSLHALVGGELEFLGISNFASGLDELTLVYNAEQHDETLAVNRAGIRGPIIGIRCDDTGETVRVRPHDTETFLQWLSRH